MRGRENPRRIVMNNNRIDELRNIVNVLNSFSESEWNTLANLLEAKTPRKSYTARKELLYDIMKELGVPPHISGYRYIIKAIEFLLDNDGTVSMTKELYPAVAKEFKTTSSRVERAIRHAVEVGMDRADVDSVYHIMGNIISFDRGKPTNSEFLYVVVNYIKLLEECNSQEG